MNKFIEFIIQAKVELIYFGIIYIIFCLVVYILDKFYHPYQSGKKLHKKKNKSKR